MSFIFEKSEEGYSEGLELFTGTTVQTGVICTELHEYGSVAALRRGSPLYFYVPGTGSSYIDLRETRLYIQCNIERQDGQPMSVNDKIGVVNMPFHSLFRQIDLSLNQILIGTSIGSNYCYKAYFDILLPPTDDYKINSSLLHSTLFVKDSADAGNDVTIPGSNEGLAIRSEYFTGGRTCELEGNIFHDFCIQRKYLPHGIDVGFKFYLQSDDFLLLTNSDVKYRMNITNAVLKVCRVFVNPAVIAAHSDIFRKEPAIYPYINSDIKTYSLPDKITRWSMDDICQGNVPSRILVAIVSQSAFSPGDQRENPYYFQNFDVNHISFAVDGKSVPGEPLQPNYGTRRSIIEEIEEIETEEEEREVVLNQPDRPNANEPVEAGGPNRRRRRVRRDSPETFTVSDGLYLPAYLRLYNGYDSLPNEGETFISRDEYPKGFAIYKFDINGPNSNHHLNLIRKGHTRLSIGFRQPVPIATTVIVYSSLNGIIQIDNTRNIVVRE